MDKHLSPLVFYALHLESNKNIPEKYHPFNQFLSERAFCYHSVRLKFYHTQSFTSKTKETKIHVLSALWGRDPMTYRHLCLPPGTALRANSIMHTKNSKTLGNHSSVALQYTKQFHALGTRIAFLPNVD